MNDAKVISVNPCKKTAGEFNFSLKALESVSRSISNPSRKTEISCKRIVNLISGINSNTDKTFSKRLLIARLISGSVIFAMAFTGAFHVLFCIVGVSLLSGLCTRIISFSALISVAAATFCAPIAAPVSLAGILLLVTLGAFSYYGPGRYSTDLFIRKSVFKAICAGARREAAHTADDNIRMDYRAYSNLKI